MTLLKRIWAWIVKIVRQPEPTPLFLASFLVISGILFYLAYLVGQHT